MTGRTRDYLADLANRKGVALPGFQNSEQAAASAKIDELKALPDANFNQLSNEARAEISGRLTRIIGEINKWTFAK